MKLPISKVVAGSALALAVAVLPLTNAFAASQSKNATVNVVVGSSISLDVSGGTGGTGTVDINVTPTAAGAVGTASHNVAVSTNNTTGYKLQLNSSTADTTLAKGADTLAATSGTKAAPANLDTNSWGYSIPGFAADTYAGVTPTGNPVVLKTTATPATNDSTTVTWGAKVDTSKPNGTYTRQVTYTAVAN